MTGDKLMSLFRQFTHQKQAQPNLSTLRFNCFAVGIWIDKPAETMVLKMSVPLKRRQWYEALFSNIQTPNCH